MSHRQRRQYGTQEFRRFPLIDFQPLPAHNVRSYTTQAWKEGQSLGTRVHYPQKIFECPKTGKQYIFWDNFLEHTKKLSPLDGPRVDFQNYTGAHDGWNYSYRDNMKLHNDIIKFEKSQASDLVRRLDLGKDQIYEDCYQRYVNRKAREEEEKKRATFPERSIGDLISKYYPRNVDALPDFTVKKKEIDPKQHIGWSHSDHVPNWFLDDKTRSTHDDLADFYANCYKTKIVRPKYGSSNVPAN